MCTSIGLRVRVVKVFNYDHKSYTGVVKEVIHKNKGFACEVDDYLKVRLGVHQSSLGKHLSQVHG
jgi:hypothetical protein